MRTFKAENGNTLTAIDETQAEAMIKGGLVEVTEDSTPVTNPESSSDKKPRKPREPRT